MSFPVLLFLAAVLFAESPGEKLRTIVRADLESAVPAADGWPALSEQASRAAEVRDRARLAALTRISRQALAGRDRVLYDLYERDLHDRLEQFSVRLHLTPFSQDPRFAQALFRLSETARSVPAPLNEAQARQRLKKLESLPGYVEQIIALRRRGKEAGMLPSAQLARQELESVRSLDPAAMPPDSPFYAPFRSLQGPKADEIRMAAQRLIRGTVRPAVERLRLFLATEYVPACRDSGSLAQWPNGAAVYAYLARHFTTTNLSPADIHELGLKEVAQIRREMSAVAANAGHTGSLDEFLAAVRTDPRYYFGNEDNLVAAYRSALARVLPVLPKVVTTMPRAQLSVESRRGGGPAAMYRPEARAVSVDVANLNIRPKFEVLPLFLHEGLPGHHLQIGLDTESPKPELEQKLGSAVAFTEGWALYSEGLGDELGLYQDPLDKFGQLSMDLVRAIRLVVDTGIHTYGWSFDKAKEYFIAQTGKADAAASEEVSRSIRPGFLLAYKVGEQRIRGMRSAAQKSLGPRFDLRRFHDALLRWGPLPLDVLERTLDECLRDEACAARELAQSVQPRATAALQWNRQM